MNVTPKCGLFQWPNCWKQHNVFLIGSFPMAYKGFLNSNPKFDVFMKASNMLQQFELVLIGDF